MNDDEALTIRERIRAGIIGTAVGDALGVPVEFTGRQMRDLDPVTGMRGFGTWNQPPGTWSDDSSMALASADILAARGWDLDAVMDGFRRWLDEAWWAPRGRVFDFGNTTRNAIATYRIDCDRRDCGQSDERDNGNGSLMRCLPVSLWLAAESAAARVALAGEASALTHAHPRARLCCAWHALWTTQVVGGRDVRAAAERAGAFLKAHVPPEERGHLAGLLDASALHRTRPQVRSDGYVVDTAEAALWCVANHDGFSSAVLAAVNLGGDTDTTAAVVGGIAGMAYGLDAIPREWIDVLARRDDILALADRFADACMTGWTGPSLG